MSAEQMETPDQITEAFARAQAEIEEIEARNGDDRGTWPAGQVTRWSNLQANLTRLDARLADLTEDRVALQRAERAAKVEAVRRAAANPSNHEHGASGMSAVVGGVHARQSDPWAGLERAGSLESLDSETGLRSRAFDAVAQFETLNDDARERLTEMLQDDQTVDSARYVLAAGNPEYQGAFNKWVRSPATAPMDSTPAELAAWRDVASMRAALNLSGGAALLPLVYDPAVHLTNTGAASEIRKYAKVSATVSNQFRAVTSPGITAEWKVEGAEAADATPTLAAVDLTVYQGFASIKGSYEVFDDTDIGAQLGGMIADARERQEAEAFVTGSGSGAPWGFVTRLAATTASRVATQTSSSFTSASVADVFKLRDAVPARHRQSSKVVFVANIAVASLIQQMSPSANGGSFWANLGEGTPARLLGVPFTEATSMSAATTASSSPVLACINLAEYQIADRLGTTVTQTNVLGSNGRSTGQWEFNARWRTSGDLLNYDAGRILRT